MFAIHNQSRSKSNHDKCLTARLAEAVRKLRVAKNHKEAQLAEMQRIIRAMHEGRPVARPGEAVGDDDGGDDTDEDSRSDAGGSEASPDVDADDGADGAGDDLLDGVEADTLAEVGEAW